MSNTCKFNGNLPSYNNTGTCEDCLERDCFFSRHNVTGKMPDDMAAAQFAEDARAASQYGVDVDTYRRWMADVPEKPWYA